MSTDQSIFPINLDFKSASGSPTYTTINTFTSYSFERSVLVPASAFRFTAPGIDKATRKSIRSGDMVSLYVKGLSGVSQQLSTGFIDETDTHGTAHSLDYGLPGRDTVGQLVDNTAVDADNRVINVKDVTLDAIAKLLIANTRMPQEIINNGVPNGTLLFQTRGGETKINALERYLQFTNCLIWAAPDGRLVIGKPNMFQPPMGSLINKSSDPTTNNVLEFRVKRNVNQAIRQMVTQIQNLDQVDAGAFTKMNSDPDVSALASAKVGRSVYSVFSYGQGTDAANQIVQVGNSSGNPKVLGEAYTLREIAKENMKVLDVEVVVRGHINENGFAYNTDQVYSVNIEADDVAEDMYVYACSFDLTLDHGATTKLHLCRLGTIVAGNSITAQVTS